VLNELLLAELPGACSFSGVRLNCCGA